MRAFRLFLASLALLGSALVAVRPAASAQQGPWVDRAEIIGGCNVQVIAMFTYPGAYEILFHPADDPGAAEGLGLVELTEDDFDETNDPVAVSTWLPGWYELDEAGVTFFIREYVPESDLGFVDVGALEAWGTDLDLPLACDEETTTTTEQPATTTTEAPAETSSTTAPASQPAARPAPAAPIRATAAYTG